jgi:YVTN family beta-propeller protein
VGLDSKARGGWRTALGVPALGILVLALAAPAIARDVYVVNSGSDDVTVIDTATGEVAGEPIGVGDIPGGIAIAPDGELAYVANYLTDDVTVIDTATGEVAGEPIAVGDGPRGVAVSPDGKRVYVANEASGALVVIDTESSEVVGEPIDVGGWPLGIAITPDGSRVYVANSGSGDVSVIDTASNEAVGMPIAVGTGPLGVAVTPDGKRVYVTNMGSDDVAVIDTATALTIDTIPVGANPVGVAIAPDGKRAYVANWGPDTVSVIDTASNEIVGLPIPVAANPLGIAVAPSGKRVYVAAGSGSVSVVDTESGKAVGGPIPAGTNPLGIAVAPNQSPLASLAAATGAAGQPVKFDATASRDPDGQVVRYDWSFGDGKTAPDAGPTPTHTYASPGAYRVTVTLSDNEGCSTSFVFTGQTASCNGSALASAASTTQVVAPPVDRPQPPPAGVSNAFRIGKLYRDKRRGIARLQVWVPGPGSLLLRGSRVRALNRTVPRSRTVTLVLRAKREKVKVLKRRGKLTVRARITFSPVGGLPRTLSRSLKLIRSR